jgi:copper transport protein
LSLLQTATELDEFLEGVADGGFGARLDTVGTFLALPALIIVVGVTVFLVIVFRGRTAELLFMLQGMAWLGLVILVGAMLQLFGAFSTLGLGWSDATSDQRLWSSLMRWFAAGLVLFGYTIEVSTVTRRRVGDQGHEDVEDQAWKPGGGALLAFVGVLLGILSFAFDGHTVTEGPRWLHSALSPVHALAGAIWLGGVVALSLLGWWRRVRDAGTVVPLIVKFSTVGAYALLAVGVAGLGMSLMIVDGPSDYVSTTWGRVLLVKVGLVLMAACFGAYNHFRVLPALERDPEDHRAANMARTIIGVEVVFLAAVSMVTVFLTWAPPD